LWVTERLRDIGDVAIAQRRDARFEVRTYAIQGIRKPVDVRCEP
jgi:hypothetical protein